MSAWIEVHSFIFLIPNYVYKQCHVKTFKVVPFIVCTGKVGNLSSRNFVDYMKSVLFFFCQPYKIRLK